MKNEDIEGVGRGNKGKKKRRDDDIIRRGRDIGKNLMIIRVNFVEEREKRN